MIVLSKLVLKFVLYVQAVGDCGEEELRGRDFEPNRVQCEGHIETTSKRPISKLN